MIIRLKKIDKRHFICFSLVFISLLFSIFYFRHAHVRLFETFKDLTTSCIFYVSELFEFDWNVVPTITEFSKTPFEMPFNLPNTWQEFKTLWNQYWTLFISSANLKAYFRAIINFVYYVSKFLVLILPLAIFLKKRLNKEIQNNNYNVNSKSLNWWKRIVEQKIYLPIKNWIFAFVDFIKLNSYWLKLFLLIWAYNLNVISIFVAFIAYYFYFVISFDFVSIYTQVLKLLKDISVMFDFLPTLFWITIIFIIIDKIRRSRAYDNLDHMERQDRGFINSTPIVIMLNGTMGSKKTTIITDIALSQEIMLRNKAFEKLLENDLKFPFFPWINLENSLKGAIKHHYVYNLATCKKWVQEKKLKFEKQPCMRNIFLYDYERYGMKYDNKLYIIDIWEVIESYSQLYFVYIIQSSLILSNYSIRVDNTLIDIGNFPIWNVDLFKKDSRMIEAFSRYAHILDFDMLRLGKRVIEDNEKADSFEFGVINITEIGKERGNAVELREIKKSDLDANQKNDLFNTWLKMVRHSATIDNFPFVKVITDDQRPESWGADARDLCELVYIDNCSEIKLSMPLFALEDWILNGLINKFNDRYYKYRFNRSDNTLLMYLYHGFIARIKDYVEGVYNTFGYYKISGSVESGRQNGNCKEVTYFLMFKKIYSKRFSTDCFSGFFVKKALRSKLGLDDLEEFNKEKASYDEMKKENSYFFSDLEKITKE